MSPWLIIAFVIGIPLLYIFFPYIAMGITYVFMQLVCFIDKIIDFFKD